jgi:uncharacterized tellurite resistance protein B-like protein
MKINAHFDRILKSNSLRWFCLILCLLSTVSLLASAGGGGGGSSDDSGDGIAGLIIYILIHVLPFPWNILAIVAFIALSMYANKKKKNQSGLNHIPSFTRLSEQNTSLPSDFIQRNPQFDETVFIQKVQTAFHEIQTAWMNQDLSKVRKWISDGVWQRFHTQFIMMQKLGQQNTMSEIHIQRSVIDSVQRDGNYDIIDVGIHFTMQDNFITEGYPELNQEGFLENIEYWTFIRKTGVQEKDIYHSQNCPNCAGALPLEMGEVSKCDHCGTTTSLGDYDWVLSEITQSTDYANENKKLDKNGNLTQRIRQQMGHDPDFAVQFIEDKASNAFMQIMTGFVLHKPEIVRRFVSNQLFEKLGTEIQNYPAYIFNRLYLNNVTLLDYYREGNKDNMVIALRRTSQRVDHSGPRFRLVEMAAYSTNEVLILSRDAGAAKAKGSLYSHNCPNCGGPTGDTLNLNCQYCGNLLNSTAHEWIVTQLMDYREYNQLSKSADLHLTTGAGEKEMDPLFKVRDYAFNNVMMIVMADGQVSQEEQAFVNKLAAKLGYDRQKLGGLFDMAKNRQLVIRLPETKEKAVKVYQKMQQAAMADGRLDAREEEILKDVQKRIDEMAA